MGTITLEVGDDQQKPYECPCCGKATHSSYGFVYSDNDAHAVYFANWVEGHEDKEVTFVVSLGEWGTDDVDPWTRNTVALKAWLKNEEIVFTVLDANETKWSKTEFIGNKLSRDQALASLDISEYFHIAEHVVSDDKAISDYLRN